MNWQVLIILKIFSSLETRWTNSGRILMFTGEKHPGGQTLLHEDSVQSKQIPRAALSLQFSINPETF